MLRYGAPVYGNGTERLETLMKESGYASPSMWDAATKYLKEFKLCKEQGRGTTDRELDEIYARFMHTFRAQTANATEAKRYETEFNKSWPMMREHIRENHARATYYLDQVVNSLSFYDAMRRIKDSNIPNATILEAAFGVTYDIAGNYGPLAMDDPSRFWDQTEPIMVEIRWRVALVYEMLKKMFESRPSGWKIMSLGCGLWPELRHYGFRKEWLLNNHFIGVDREFHQAELDNVFQYAHGLSFAETGIEFIQNEIHKIAQSGDFDGWADFTMLMGVLSYAKNDDEACQLLDDAFRVTKPGRVTPCDTQVRDDTLVSKVAIFGWSEEYPLRPDPSVEEGLQRWNRIFKEVGAKVERCEVDPRNQEEVGITFFVSRT